MEGRKMKNYIQKVSKNGRQKDKKLHKRTKVQIYCKTERQKDI